MTRSVLIIDDEAEVGHALRRVLERAGYGVTTVTSSAEGLAAFAANPVDIVITDIIMPKSHGIDVIKAIRAKGTPTRIVAISGGGNFGPVNYQPEAITTTAYLAAAKEAGADEALTKPFDKADLLALLKRLFPT